MQARQLSRLNGGGNREMEVVLKNLQYVGIYIVSIAHMQRQVCEDRTSNNSKVDYSLSRKCFNVPREWQGGKHA